MTCKHRWAESEFKIDPMSGNRFQFYRCSRCGSETMAIQNGEISNAASTVSTDNPDVPTLSMVVHPSPHSIELPPNSRPQWLVRVGG